MAIRIVGKSNPSCPLCDKPFLFIQHRGRDFYVCKTDKVAIVTKDPMINNWNNHKDLETNMEIPCPNQKCRSRMNLFCRSDGYMKAVCSNPKCRATIATDELTDGNYDTKKGIGDRLVDS